MPACFWPVQKIFCHRRRIGDPAGGGEILPHTGKFAVGRKTSGQDLLAELQLGQAGALIEELAGGETS